MEKWRTKHGKNRTSNWATFKACPKWLLNQSDAAITFQHFIPSVNLGRQQNKAFFSKRWQRSTRPDWSSSGSAGCRNTHQQQHPWHGLERRGGGEGDDLC